MRHKRHTVVRLIILFITYDPTFIYKCKMCLLVKCHRVEV